MEPDLLWIATSLDWRRLITSWRKRFCKGTCSTNVTELEETDDE